MNITQIANIGALITRALAVGLKTATAAGTGDNTAVNGNAVDRLDPVTGALAGSGVFDLAYHAVLAQDKTLSLKNVSIDQSDDGVTFDSTPYLSIDDPGVIATGGAGGSTEEGLWKSDSIDLRSAKRFVRLTYTPDLSNTATDTLSSMGHATLGGYDRLAA